MDTRKEEFLQCLQDAEMVLIGLGEEFDEFRTLRQDTDYLEVREKINNSEYAWLIPAWNMLQNRMDAYESLKRFAELIADKNYFVVSVSTNDRIADVPWRDERLVMPCGGSRMKQCGENCGHSLVETTKEDWDAMKSVLNNLHDVNRSESDAFGLGMCPSCGSPLVLNSVYTTKYDENGYLEQWKTYTKWLQGTLNRKLMILELGVSLQCPSVIRWPFEKVAFFNQKASFWRVNEKFYQLSEELGGKGTSISRNAIDWLNDLC